MSFLKPRLVAAAPHGPVALAGGRTSIHVVAEGAGVLVVGDVRRRFWRGLDAHVLVEVAPRILVRVRGLLGGEQLELVLTPRSPAPAPVDAPALPSVPRAHVHVPDLIAERQGARSEDLGVGELAAQHRLRRAKHVRVRDEVRVPDSPG